MAYLKFVYSCLLFLLSYNELASAKLILVDGNAEYTGLLKNYDDYDPIDAFTDDEDDRNRNQNDYEIFKNDAKLTLGTDRKKERINRRCQRVFGSMYGIREQYIRCMKSLTHKRTSDRTNDARWKQKSAVFYVPGIQLGSSKDSTKFSKDYIDFKDLGRAHFASDYIYIDDFKRLEVPCDAIKLEEFGDVGNSDCFPDVG